MIMPVNMLSALSRCSINETYAATTYLKCATHIFLGSERNYHTATEKEEELKCYKTLELPIGCDQEQLRSTFLQLVKRYHPDSGSNEADADRFQQIEAAYRKLQDKFARERGKQNEGEGEYGLYYQEKEDESCIKHTAPQHRQYLSYDGFGAGTPQQREKQYQVYRAAVAQENVYRHKVDKITSQLGAADALIFKDKKEAKKHKTRYGMDRLVEDLIQESMQRGEFDNLPGKGKPLPKKNVYPYVDFITQKMNQMLVENGFAPEWITLQKEIKDDVQNIRRNLYCYRERLGRCPLSAEDEQLWKNTLTRHEEMSKQLNSKINKYNLIVPLMQKQMLLFNLEREAEKILQEGQTKCDVETSIHSEQSKHKQDASINSSGFLGFLEAIFSKSH